MNMEICPRLLGKAGDETNKTIIAHMKLFNSNGLTFLLWYKIAHEYWAFLLDDNSISNPLRSDQSYILEKLIQTTNNKHYSKMI